MKKVHVCSFIKTIAPTIQSDRQSSCILFRHRYKESVKTDGTIAMPSIDTAGTRRAEAAALRHQARVLTFCHCAKRESCAPKLTRSQGCVFFNPARLRNLAKSASWLRVLPHRERAESWALLRRRDHHNLPRDHVIAHVGIEETTTL
jgi:hypothetical protein